MVSLEAKYRAAEARYAALRGERGPYLRAGLAALNADHAAFEERYAALDRQSAILRKQSNELPLESDREAACKAMLATERELMDCLGQWAKRQGDHHNVVVRHTVALDVAEQELIKAEKALSDAKSAKAIHGIENLAELLKKVESVAEPAATHGGKRQRRGMQACGDGSKGHSSEKKDQLAEKKLVLMNAFIKEHS
jgi:hypothetical protein